MKFYGEKYGKWAAPKKTKKKWIPFKEWRKQLKQGPTFRRIYNIHPPNHGINPVTAEEWDILHMMDTMDNSDSAWKQAQWTFHE